jgi:hypothetical protein
MDDEQDRKTPLIPPTFDWGMDIGRDGSTTPRSVGANVAVDLLYHQKIPIHDLARMPDTLDGIPIHDWLLARRRIINETGDGDLLTGLQRLIDVYRAKRAREANGQHRG